MAHFETAAQNDRVRTALAKNDALAVDGGRPVRRRLLPYGRQSISPDDIRAVLRILRSDWLTTGPAVGAFEEAFAAYVGAKHAVSFSSGTAALHAAIFAAGLGPGDEAVVPALTFCATANCLLYQGATPVFADVQSDTLNLDPDSVEGCLSPRTKAILPVDYAGHPADLPALKALVKKRGLIIIEDACHALGARLAGRHVGSLSDMTVFSFHPVKHITTGEGGMVTTDNHDFAGRLRLFRSHGIASDARQRQASGEWFYEMVALGYNYRLTDIAAALGLSQLKRINANLAQRRRIASIYQKEFQGMSALQTPAVLPGADPSWHLYPVRLNLERLRRRRGDVFRALRAENLGVNVHYVPVYKHPYYREKFGDQAGRCPVAEDAYERLISLPIFHGMSFQDARDVVRAVNKVVSAYAA